MNHIGTKTIETERLILRQFTVEDSQAMFENWASDDEVTKYLTWPTHTSEEISKSILRDWVDSYKMPDTYNWAITLKSLNNQPIGNIAVVELREKAKAAQLGYCIGRNWWHQGIMSEALSAVKDFLFVMMKCGLKYEGTLRQADWNNQGICDCCIYGLIKADK